MQPELQPERVRLVCSECQTMAGSATVHTARLPDGTVLSRWYRCNDCGHRWVPADPVPSAEEPTE